MGTTLKATVTAAAAALFVALATFGIGAIDLRATVADVVHGVQENAGTAAVATVASTLTPEEVEHEAILELISEHRRSASIEWRVRLADAIVSEAAEAGMDPLMVASIVAKESSFKSRVVSHAGAVGLMQLRPFVAEDVARRGQIEWNGIETLHNPELNVRLGILYYKELVDRFDGDPTAALTAYNQGPTRVSRKLRKGTYNGSDYAERILGLYETIKTETAETLSRT